MFFNVCLDLILFTATVTKSETNVPRGTLGRLEHGLRPTPLVPTDGAEKIHPISSYSQSERGLRKSGEKGFHVKP